MRTRPLGRLSSLLSPAALLLSAGLAVAQQPASSAVPAPLPAGPAAAPKAAAAPTANPVQVQPIPSIISASSTEFWAQPSEVVPPAPPERPCDHVWITGEYLLWWMKDAPLPVPLVTAGTTGNGVLGAADTVVLFGGHNLDFQDFSGARFAAGFLASKDLGLGFEGTGFFFERKRVEFDAASSTGVPLLARPFVNSLDGAESAFVVSQAGVSAGAVAVTADSRLFGFGVNSVAKAFRDEGASVDLYVGYQNDVLEEDLNVYSRSTALGSNALAFAGATLPAGSAVGVQDSFTVQNQFHGGRFGARGAWQAGCFMVDGWSQLALGNNHEIIHILGASSAINAVGAVTSTVPGGVLALGGNSGRFSRDEFAVIPEAGLRLSCCVSRHICLSAGYSFLYWSDVVRPGQLVSRTINPTLVPTVQPPVGFAAGAGTLQPGVAVTSTDFWAQGFTFGVTLRY